MKNFNKLIELANNNKLNVDQIKELDGYAIELLDRVFNLNICEVCGEFTTNDAYCDECTADAEACAADPHSYYGINKVDFL